jgi:hypothetical protein
VQSANKKKKKNTPNHFTYPSADCASATSLLWSLAHSSAVATALTSRMSHDSSVAPFGNRRTPGSAFAILVVGLSTTLANAPKPVTRILTAGMERECVWGSVFDTTPTRAGGGGIQRKKKKRVKKSRKNFTKQKKKKKKNP